MATLPDIAAIQAIVDAAFWASLRREEGFIPKISLAFLAPEETKNALLFERPLPLDPGVLPKCRRPWNVLESIWASGADRKACAYGAPRARFPRCAS